MKSMTGYSRTTSDEIEGLRFVVEIHCVNRKHLDIHLFMPRELLFLDIEIRKLIADSLSRGAVTVKISYETQTQTQATLTLLKALKAKWETVAHALGFQSEEITLSFLLDQFKNTPLDGFSPKVTKILKETVQEGLESLEKMQKGEGKALETVLLDNLKTFTEHLHQVEILSLNAPLEYKNKFQHRLKELLDEALSEERLLKEVALIAEKMDVTEEIVRLQSHLAQMKETIASTAPIGRSLDFLLQEMHRETNTISAKTQDLEVTKHTLKMKQELEKIREQVQNIE